MREMSGDLFPKSLDDEMAVVTLLESENVPKVWPCISLIGVRDSEIAIASKVNMEAICDDL
jgi:hypothetical protein